MHLNNQYGSWASDWADGLDSDGSGSGGKGLLPLSSESNNTAKIRTKGSFLNGRKNYNKIETNYVDFVLLTTSPKISFTLYSVKHRMHGVYITS